MIPRSPLFRPFVAALALAFAPAGDALAQEAFELNSVLVATFEHTSPDLEYESKRIHDLIERAVGEAYLVVPMSEVAPFSDYDAETYVKSCPRGQYVGCAFVIGGRARTDWTIGGSLKPAAEGVTVTLSFIQVAQSKLVAELSFDVTPENERDVAKGVVQALDALIAGNLEEIDVRGTSEQREAEERARAAAAAREQQRATSVARADEDIDEELGEVERVREAPAAPQRVTREDLAAEAEERGSGDPPWIELGLTEKQYLDYKNSGLNIAAWRDKRLGRTGDILIGIVGGYSQGGWGQRFEGAFAWAYPEAGSAQLSIGEQRLLGEQVKAGSGFAELELGVGLQSWLEVVGTVGIGTSPYIYRFYQEGPTPPGQEPTANPLPDPATVGITGLRVGGKVGVAPFPLAPARPTVHAGVLYFQGTNAEDRFDGGASAQLDFAGLPATNLLLVQVQPGAEISVGRNILIRARFDVDIPVGGTRLTEYKAGYRLLTQTGRPQPENDNLLGLGGQVGMTFRIPTRPVPKASGAR